MEEDYIEVDEAAQILRITPRQVNRYGNDGRIRTKRAGRRVFYLRTDVEALAEELDVDHRPSPKSPKAELVPVGEMLEYLRDRDQKVDELQGKLVAAAAEVGRLTGIIEQQKQLMEDRDNLLQRITQLEAQLVDAQRPWYKKWFG